MASFGSCSRRAQTATQLSRPSNVSPTRHRQDEIDEFREWRRYGDNARVMPRPRIIQDFAHIIDIPGPGEYSPEPERLSTQETFPKYSIGVRYPALVIGEKDRNNFPSPIYDIPPTVQIMEYQTFGYHPPVVLDENRKKDLAPSLAKYSPSDKISSRYERFPAAVMAKRKRVVLPRTVVDMRNLSIYESFGKCETMDPGLYHSNVLRRDPREISKSVTIGQRLKEPHPEGLDFKRPSPGDYDADSGLFGELPLQNGFAFPSPVRKLREDVMRSSFVPKGSPDRVYLKWGGREGVAKRDEARKHIKSEYSFPKNPLQPKRATGKNSISTVQNSTYFFKGRQSPGTLRF